MSPTPASFPAASSPSASTQPASVAPTSSAPAVEGRGVSTQEPEGRERAAVFDRFLQKRAKPKELADFREGCEKDRTQVLCYPFLEYDALEARLRARAERKPRAPRVRPKFANHEIANWAEVRGALVTPLIKAFARASKAHVEDAKAQALKETECPNNVAIAIAAALEDRLPDGADEAELGQLYERGGACLENPDDRENFLTRAGLFFYHKRDLARAAAVWQRAAAVEEAKSPRPHYWLYRALIEQGDHSGAKAALTKLRERFPFSFHTVMARLREKQEPDDVIAEAGGKTLPRSVKVPEVNTLVDAAELLKDCGYNKSAAKVLDWAVKDATNAEPEFRLHLAELKVSVDDIHDSLMLLSKLLLENPSMVSRRTLSMYFPKPYYELFDKHAEETDPYLLLAIARQESAFNAQAVSPARAKGLLQVLSRGRVGRGNLLDPETNIKIGSRLFARMLDRSDGKLYLALSAYNAGPMRAVSWARRYTTTDPILFVDLIPFKETRAYVALILRNYYWYRRIHRPDAKRLPWVYLSDDDDEVWLGTRALATSD